MAHTVTVIVTGLTGTGKFAICALIEKALSSHGLECLYENPLKPTDPPDGNRTPTAAEAHACGLHLEMDDLTFIIGIPKINISEINIPRDTPPKS